jgi:hypothetical protein
MNKDEWILPYMTPVLKDLLQNIFLDELELQTVVITSYDMPSYKLGT